MSHINKSTEKWTTQDFMSFVLSLGIKGKVYEQIKKEMADGYQANDIATCTPIDIKDALHINMIMAKKIQKGLVQLTVKESMPNAPSNSSTSNHASMFGRNGFSVHLRGAEGKRTTLRKSFTIKSTIAEVARSYKEQESVAMSYKVEEIRFVAKSQELHHDKTLGEYGIVDEKNLLCVIFRAKGGAMAANNGMDRSIKFKKYGLRQTSLPDVLIGYTDDDGVERALLECGKHAMAAETMFQYITTSLASNVNQTDLTCPGTRDKACGKLLDWDTCTRIADMNEAEYMKWTEMIEKRAMKNYKQCPHCKNFCMRDPGVAIFRMKCIACKGSDWCWECAQPWKGSGLSMCCNQNCSLIMDTNARLLKCPMVNVEYTNVAMPKFRACPRCLTFIDWTNACKHMKCTGCGKSFCFVCLGLKGKEDDDSTWPCGSHTTVCKTADRQQFK
eukprot:374158_1